MLRARRPVFAGRLRHILDQVSTGFLIAAIVVVMTVNFDAVLRISGSGAITAALLFTLLAALAGWSLGTGGVAQRSVLGLVGQRPHRHQNDHGTARPPHPPPPHRRDRQPFLPLPPQRRERQIQDRTEGANQAGWDNP